MSWLYRAVLLAALAAPFPGAAEERAAQINAVLFAPGECRGGSGTLQVVGCNSGATLTFKGDNLGAVKAVSLTSTSATAACTLMDTPTLQEINCVLSEVNTPEEGATFKIGLDEEGSEATVEVGFFVKVEEVDVEAARCMVVGGGDAQRTACMQNALLTLHGTQLDFVRSISLRDNSTLPENCPKRSGYCEIAVQSTTMIVCRLRYAPADYLTAGCNPKKAPTMVVSVQREKWSTDAPFAFNILEEPKIMNVSSEDGACSIGVRHNELRGCVDGARIVVDGVFLDVPDLHDASGPAVVLTRLRDAAGIDCVRKRASFTQVMCVVQGRGEATDYSVAVFSAAGSSEEASYAPNAPVVQSASYMRGCTGGNTSMSLSGCSNGTHIEFSGTGFGHSAVTRDKRNQQKITAVVTRSDIPVNATCVCTVQLVVLPQATEAANDAAVTCQLVCTTETRAAELRIYIESNDVRSKEGVLVSFAGPPVVSAMEGCADTVQESPKSPLWSADAPAPRVCKTGDSVVLIGSGFTDLVSVMLVPMKEEDGQLRPYHFTRNNLLPSLTSLNTTCLIDAASSTTTRLVCKLAYTEIPREGVMMYSMYVQGKRGVSLPLPIISASGLRGLTEEDVTVYLDSAPRSVYLPIVRLFPPPKINSLYGCVNSAKGDTTVILETCLLKDGSVLSISGSGFSADLLGNNVTFRTLESNPNTPPRCVVTQVLTTMLTCSIEVRSDHFGIYDISVVTTGGAHTMGNSVKFIAKPEITQFSGCSPNVVHDTPKEAITNTNTNTNTNSTVVMLGEQLRSSLESIRNGTANTVTKLDAALVNSVSTLTTSLGLNSTNTATDREAGTLTDHTQTQPQTQGIVCKNDDVLLIHGAGFDPDEGVSVVIRNKADNSHLKEQEASVVVIDRNTVSVSLRHRYAAGTEYEVKLGTIGGEAVHATHIELLPLPILQRISSTTCMVHGVANPTKRVTKKKDDFYPQGDDEDEVDTLVCTHGNEVELHGKNLKDIKNPVVFTMHNTMPEDTVPPPPAVPEAVKGNATKAVIDTTIFAPCHVVTASETSVTCRMFHTFQKGKFFPLIETRGGFARLVREEQVQQAAEFPGIDLIPLPIIHSLAYRTTSSSCLEGNNTRSLGGCVSGTIITITGANFDNKPRVVLQAGNEGGTNGPPECWVTNIKEGKLICVLDHTSAAGAFRVEVRDAYGTSVEKSVTVSVIPGNLYLLFKNTRLVLTVSNAVGWICSVLWTGSLATLAWSNEKAKSTAGITPDMVLYNLIGLLGWNIFSVYFYVHDELGVPVFIQDICYSTTSYAVVLWFVTQMVRFGTAPFTLFAKFYCMVLFIFVANSAIDTKFGENMPEFVSVLGRLHLACAVVKYMPQVKYNYVRKSTEGYSIVAVWMDFGGAMLLLLQMFFDGIIRHKWSLMITLNVPKFALCCEVILFNIVYAVQHYILYPGRLPLEEKLSSRPASPNNSPHPKRQRIQDSAGLLKKRPPSESD